MLGEVLLAASRNKRARRAVSRFPLTRRVVDRFVAGEQTIDAVTATRRLADLGLMSTIDHLGEEVRDTGAAVETTKAYVRLLEALRPLGFGDRAEVSVKLSAVGQALDDGMALDHAQQICEAARENGSTVTLDMEDHTTVDSTLAILQALRTDFPDTGVAIQSYLIRSEADCRDLRDSRVRLVKGAYDEPASVAYQRKSEVDRAYVRCLKVLMSGTGYPMIATHDDRLITIAETLADGRPGYEFQMLYGIRTDKQLALARSGANVRVYVPYGDDWYGYFMRRLAERPANVTFFLRSLGGK
ncbi:proline dehydrogenase family protein [Acrocarpospora macrocephala]|uniref:proline dehydrogenase n=1 Tax=Acrocarpospora macrocephala TaxID=150177 RepID=A0A5M3X1M0_9ACTN|nr:proline dehydrogenase family protein [Acrocarpospora macrocephala]GES12643.1 proline dehydrogenase [Acrocarpospora macrocephala]